MTDWETAAKDYAAELLKRPAAIFVPPDDTAWMAWATTLAALAGIFLIVWIVHRVAQRVPRVSAGDDEGFRTGVRNAAIALVGWITLVCGAQWLFTGTLPSGGRDWTTTLLTGSLWAALAYGRERAIHRRR